MATIDCKWQLPSFDGLATRMGVLVPTSYPWHPLCIFIVFLQPLKSYPPTVFLGMRAAVAAEFS